MASGAGKEVQNAVVGVAVFDLVRRGENIFHHHCASFPFSFGDSTGLERVQPDPRRESLEDDFDDQGAGRGGELWNRMPGERSAWLGNKALAELVLEAVRNVDGKELSPPAPSSSDPGYERRLLLAALTYFYSIGVFSSQDSGQSMRADAGFRASRGIEFPD